MFPCCLVTKWCLTLATPWPVACQALLSMGFPGQEYWSSLPFPSPGDPPNSRIKPRSPALQADSLSSEPKVGFAETDCLVVRKNYDIHYVDVPQCTEDIDGPIDLSGNTLEALEALMREV